MSFAEKFSGDAHGVVPYAHGTRCAAIYSTVWDIFGKTAACHLLTSRSKISTMTIIGQGHNPSHTAKTAMTHTIKMTTPFYTGNVQWLFVGKCVVKFKKIDK